MARDRVTPCGWWVRWWHRRLRRADRTFFLPRLVEAPGLTHSERAEALFGFFMAHGQEHWRCGCSDDEATAALEAAIAEVAAGGDAA